jgi:hypothetical protein
MQINMSDRNDAAGIPSVDVSKSLNFFIIDFVEATSHMSHGAIQQLERTHEDGSQIGDGVGRRIFGIRFRRVDRVCRTGGADHGSRAVLPAV